MKTIESPDAWHVCRRVEYPTPVIAEDIQLLDQQKRGSTHALDPPASVTARSDTDFESFEYTALDRGKQSIRLVQVLPGLYKGFVQCHIRHSTIEDSYTCLSYEWGSDEQTNPILINDRLFFVRQNLLDFLHIATRQPEWQSKWLWIDALCIDQQDIQERNHQVQQMGSIYSEADEVIAWLGMDSKIESFLDNPEQGLEEDSNGIWSTTAGFEAFYNSTYFNRAWITQEVVLARRIILAAGCHQLDHQQLSALLHYLTPLLTHNYELFSPRRLDLRGRSLMDLLGKFKTKESRDPCDRIYSLLALCGDNPGIRVDYSMSDEDVASHVLTACRSSFCLCAIIAVGDALSLRDMSEWSGSSRNTHRYTASAANTGHLSFVEFCRDSGPVDTYQQIAFAPTTSSGTEVHISCLDLRNKQILLKFACRSNEKNLDLTHAGCSIEMFNDGNVCTLGIPLRALFGGDMSHYIHDIQSPNILWFYDAGTWRRSGSGIVPFFKLNARYIIIAEEQYAAMISRIHNQALFGLTYHLKLYWKQFANRRGLLLPESRSYHPLLLPPTLAAATQASNAPGRKRGHRGLATGQKKRTISRRTLRCRFPWPTNRTLSYSQSQ